MKKINLASNRFAFIVLAVLAGLIFLSAVIPQQGIAQDQILDWRDLLGRGYVVIEKLWLDRIYTSPLFLGVAGLLCVNLVAGNVVRIRRLRASRAVRTRVRLIGSVFFHFALPLIIVGATLNHLYRFGVVFGLTEGQTARDLPADYFREFSGPLCRTQYGKFTIGLDRVHPALPVGDTTTEAAEIRVVSFGGGTTTNGVIRVNRPVRWQGLEFHLGAQIGYSPELKGTNPAGRELFRSFVRLARRREEDGTVDADVVFLPTDSTRIELKILFGPEPSDSARTWVAVERDGREIYSGEPRFQGAQLPGGQRVAVPRLRRWCYVEVVRYPFMNVVFAGFWIALGGLIVTLVPRLVPRRKKVL
jgi:cytochrome c biogenesis protein ResB